MGMCRRHGGGKRCFCGTPVAAPGIHCKAHGGGHRCSVKGCTSVSNKACIGTSLLHKNMSSNIILTVFAIVWSRVRAILRILGASGMVVVVDALQRVVLR